MFKVFKWTMEDYILVTLYVFVSTINRYYPSVFVGKQDGPDDARIRGWRAQYEI